MHHPAPHLPTLAALSALIASGLAAPALAGGGCNLVTNGVFESATLFGWTHTAPYPAVIDDALMRSCCGSTGAFAQGTRVCVWNAADSAPSGSASQTLATIPGRRYSVRFDFGKWSPPEVEGVSALRFRVLNAQSQAALIDETLADTEGTLDLPSILSPYAFEFVAEEETTEIRFDDASEITISADAILDNVRVELLEPCSVADLDQCFGQLDLADITAFTTGFLASDSIADLNGDTLFDLRDITAFVGAFTEGCP